MFKRSRILKIIVPTPHNTPITMWGRDKDFYNPRSFEHRNHENKISKRIFFATHVMYILTKTQNVIGLTSKEEKLFTIQPINLILVRFPLEI